MFEISEVEIHCMTATVEKNRPVGGLAIGCRGVASIEAEEAVTSSLFADLVVRWVRTNPPSSLQYQLFLRVELILDCKHSKNSLAAGWSTTRRAGRRRDVSVIIDGRVQNFEIS